MKKTVTVNSAEQTIEVGEKLAQFLQPRDLILLDGDLGAGKTTFTKGLGKGLGIERPIKSPTFTIIREYQSGRIPLYHMDVYRLEQGGGDDLGLDEYFNGDGVNVVEWSKFVSDEIPTDYLRIIFKRDDAKGDNVRTMIFEPKGNRFEELTTKLLGEI
ncbi:tRNA (adenosine(37)-N6)-threonylcarbamoyltransferase complex ATPase subunit type 1 TsaE [Lentilactobacillus hilgardii]|uniref:tRNA (adenosine(37)-N6)-threonylcarbamoyltransferase complex ATPase subunit type 1 TsaE n=1 Tax=Lentilactobacillus hilgardii TaxID=1588 RepID=UPI0021C333A7|nr:tRNA (adenosine(37)-N6)-threonylcarbamoyltransferase complex ATPase subunit type 1 TsaE [Lentilactobacillus hilgardii]MCP9334038.1 tRNA (adenosine(37)-N6)-threonylcarbamoyltransferase complex ATPase subunit type 1 TsaE [Lentilactobacillus hilgardii]MCP9350651.1 tRNA (adenosine(37)-N6)-threonylcarbamoyltransferase complex ATPase subunit type 1 TsaE [Lentilactobacillus hilgardii]MCP9353491.1 tRNA (adenosine(37)-N6)-threonylcarbamoyltransferase complex ATPase subunit type 1 TsaE [Lentilactobacil